MILLMMVLGVIPWETALLRVSGASTLEELSADEMERYESLRDSPVRLNSAGRGRLLETGLFSRYQAASILEYRARNGNILSFSELALVDGIGEQMAQALRYFVVLGESPPGKGTSSGGRGFSGKLTSRAGVKVPSEGETTASFGSKLTVSYGETLSLNMGGVRSYDGKDASSWSAQYRGRGFPVRLVLGAFNVRFGQGLGLWSGFSMSGASSPEALCRNPSGVSPASSFNGSGRLRGVASGFCFGRWDLSLAATKELAAVNLGRSSLKGQWSVSGILTQGGGTVAADFKYALAGLDFWGEGAVETAFSAPALILGAGWSPAYKTRIAAVGRYYSPLYEGRWAGGIRAATKTSDDAGFAIAMTRLWATATYEWCLHPSSGRTQGKLLLKAYPVFRLGDAALTTGVRFALRDRPYEARRLRPDLRGEADFAAGSWQLHGRYETVWLKERSWMWYAESLYRRESGEAGFRAALRAGLFKVDEWEGRIYVYERDLPGMFTVPALYGRGWNASLVAGLRLRARPCSARSLRPGHDLDLRTGIISYPWTVPAKPSRLEARLQYSLRW